MSFSKEILFGDDPRYDAAREKMREQTSAVVDQFPFKVSRRRKSLTPGLAYSDPIWPKSIDTAAERLGIAKINVNS